MKRIISVLVLVCIMASFCTVSAFALGLEIVNLTSGISIVSDGVTEKIVFSVNAKEVVPNCVIELHSREGLISKTTPVSSDLSAGATSCDIVLKGTASDVWNTEFYSATDYIYPWIIAITSNGNLLDRYFFEGATDLTADQKAAFNSLESSVFRLFTSVSNPKPMTGTREAYTFDVLTQGEIKDFKAVVYCNGKVLATTVPTETRAPGGVFPAYTQGITVSMRLGGSESSSWNTTIGNIVKGDYPDKLELYSGSERIYSSDFSWTAEDKATFDSTVFAQNLPEAPYDLQEDLNNAIGNSSQVQLPAEQVVVSEPIKVPAKAVVEIVPSASVPVVEQFSLASGCDSIFELGEEATVKIVGEYSDAEIKQVRELLKKEYCVRKGSIIIDDSHNLGSDGKCLDCAVQVVPNPYSVPATADNSNMPLWTALFIAFAAVALLTGKKKKA